jgi:ATP adenylyltransferase
MLLPGSGLLWQKIRSQFDAALESGHLLFTESSVEVVEEAGILFQLRLAPSLAKKPAGRIKARRDTSESVSTGCDTSDAGYNPFLEPEKALIVMEFDDHRLLLYAFA